MLFLIGDCPVGVRLEVSVSTESMDSRISLPSNCSLISNNEHIEISHYIAYIEIQNILL